MQLISRKALRTAVATGGAVLALGAGASAASAATTVQNYTGGAWANTASGTSVGTPSGSTLTSAATLTTPAGNASCTKGNITGTLGTNPGTTVPLTPTAFNLNTCTDTIAAYNINNAALNAAGANATIAGTSASGGTLTISNSTTFKINATLTSGLSLVCNVQPTTSGGANTTAVGTLTNPTATPPGTDGKVTFTNILVKSTDAAGSTCANTINGSPATYSTFSATFNNLQVISNGTKLRVTGP